METTKKFLALSQTASECICMYAAWQLDSRETMWPMRKMVAFSPSPYLQIYTIPFPKAEGSEPGMYATWTVSRFDWYWCSTVQNQQIGGWCANRRFIQKQYRLLKSPSTNFLRAHISFALQCAISASMFFNGE